MEESRGRRRRSVRQRQRKPHRSSAGSMHASWQVHSFVNTASSQTLQRASRHLPPPQRGRPARRCPRAAAAHGSARLASSGGCCRLLKDRALREIGTTTLPLCPCEAEGETGEAQRRGRSVAAAGQAPAIRARPASRLGCDSCNPMCAEREQGSAGRQATSRQVDLLTASLLTRLASTARSPTVLRGGPRHCQSGWHGAPP